MATATVSTQVENIVLFGLQKGVRCSIFDPVFVGLAHILRLRRLTINVRRRALSLFIISLVSI